MSPIFTDRSQSVFPKTRNASIGQCIAIECFISFFQWNDRIFTVSFFYPLHHIKRIIQYFLASLYEFPVFALFKIGIIGILFVESMIVINEINRSERTVLLYLTYYPTDTVSVVRIIFLIQSYSIISHRNQSARLRYIKAYTLVHDSNQVFCLHTRTGFFGISVRHFVRRKHYFRICPLITVFRGHKERLGRWYMFI